MHFLTKARSVSRDDLSLSLADPPEETERDRDLDLERLLLLLPEGVLDLEGVLPDRDPEPEPCEDPERLRVRREEQDP